jgi:predicted nucleic acid-binding protein
MLAAVLKRHARVIVPAVILAETLTGKPVDAPVRAALRHLTIIPISEGIAARAGALRTAAVPQRHKPRDLTVDALVVATAERLLPATVITADPGDIALLAGSIDIKPVTA